MMIESQSQPDLSHTNQLATTPRCMQCGAPAAHWCQATYTFVCAGCAPGLEQALAAWRENVQWLLAQQMEQWLQAVPDEDIAILLFALLDNGVQALFGIHHRVVNLEEAATLIATLDSVERRTLLPALIAHRLTDSLWIWQALAPHLALAQAVPAPDFTRSVG